MKKRNRGVASSSPTPLGKSRWKARSSLSGRVPGTLAVSLAVVSLRGVATIPGLAAPARRFWNQLTLVTALCAAGMIIRMYDALRSAEAARWGPLNWHFHSALYAPANRNFTMSVLQKMHQHSDRYFRIFLVLSQGGARAVE